MEYFVSITVASDDGANTDIPDLTAGMASVIKQLESQSYGFTVEGVSVHLANSEPYDPSADPMVAADQLVEAVTRFCREHNGYIQQEADLYHKEFDRLVTAYNLNRGN